MQNAISIHTIASRRARTAGGFTLTELLTVVAIIVLLIGSLFAAISAATRRAHRVKTQFLMNTISSGLSQFQTDFGYLPPVLMKRSGAAAGSSGFLRDVTAIGQVTGGDTFAKQQNWLSYTTLAEFLLGYGDRSADGYGVVAGGPAGDGTKESPPFGIRSPGSDGCWGAIDAPQPAFANLLGYYAARNPNRDAAPPPVGAPAWNTVAIEGRVYGPYIDQMDERMIGGISGLDAQGNPIIVTADQGATNFGALPKCILDYWGSPIAYYRAPYSGSDLRSELPDGGDGFFNLGDIYVLRSWDVNTKETAVGAADANGDDTSSPGLKGASFALLSKGADRTFDRSVRRDLAEFNKDNIVETGK